MNNAVYLVVEPIEIVATDLAMNIQDHDPSALVLIALSPEAACAKLENHMAVRLAFVHADPMGFAATGLARALKGRGALVVFCGDAAERKPQGILVLQRPFSTQTTAALLRGCETAQSA